jgi:hypothetical protein
MAGLRGGREGCPPPDPPMGSLGISGAGRVTVFRGERLPTMGTVALGKPFSRIWRDRLVGAAASAILTIAGLWFVIVAGAAASYIFWG